MHVGAHVLMSRNVFTGYRCTVSLSLLSAEFQWVSLVEDIDNASIAFWMIIIRC